MQTAVYVLELAEKAKHRKKIGRSYGLESGHQQCAETTNFYLFHLTKITNNKNNIAAIFRRGYSKINVFMTEDVIKKAIQFDAHSFRSQSITPFPLINELVRYSLPL